MSTTLEESNQALRAAVKHRLDNTDPDDEKLIGYKPPPLAGCEPAQQCAAAVLSQAWRADSVLPQHRASGSLEWLDALERLRALHYEKTAQYGGAEDAFENVTASSKCGVEPWRRALCDLSDCVVRMQKYAQGQPVDPTNALLDAANWALICLVKMEQQRG